MNITGGSTGVDTTGTGTGSVTMAINDLNISGQSAEGLQFTNLNAGTIEVNTTTVSNGTVALDFAAANTGSLNLRVLNSTFNNNATVALTGTGHFGMLVDNTDITTGNTDIAFSLTQSGAAQNADVTFRNGNNFMTGDANALFISSSGANGKTFNLLVEDSLFTNNSATASTADITAASTSLMNNTIQGNTFTNANVGGVNVNITSNGATAVMNLNLGGDTTDRNTASGGTGEFRVHELVGSDFNVFERDDTFNDLRNTGTVVTDPNDAAFDDLATPPTLPTVPPGP
jgi:hypothetical protein